MLTDGDLLLRACALLALALIAWALWPTSDDEAEWHACHTLRGKLMGRRLGGVWQYRGMTAGEASRDAKEEAW